MTLTMTPTRRSFLVAFAAVPSLPLMPGLALAQNLPEAGLRLTPACGGDETPAQTEGPFFSPNSPLKRDFAFDAPDAERITLAGYVLGGDCQPHAGALVELWLADDEGRYDNDGFRLRGHQFADERGRWWFDTIVPGLYPGRTRHYHVKVQKPGGRALTTQLYFPDEPANGDDGIFDAALLLTVAKAKDGLFGRYDFVLA